VSHAVSSIVYHSTYLWTNRDVAIGETTCIQLVQLVQTPDTRATWTTPTWRLMTYIHVHSGSSSSAPPTQRRRPTQRRHPTQQRLSHAAKTTPELLTLGSSSVGNHCYWLFARVTPVIGTDNLS